MKYLIGTDPELFVKKDGVLASAHGLVKGDKKNPLLVKNGAVQVDGMALEFNTDPTNNEDEFVHHISSVMGQLKEMVPEYEFFVEPTAHFGQEYIDSQPEEAKDLGCDPDYNAYTGKINEKPDGGLGFRTGAGHIHIGWTDGEDINDPFHFDECCEVVKQLDAYLGLGSLLFDKDTERRQMYGKAGSFRPKPYGVEYRPLSNAWLKSEELQRWVFSTAQLAVERLVAGEGVTPVKQNRVRRWMDGDRGVQERDVKGILSDLNIPFPPFVEEEKKEEEEGDIGYSIKVDVNWVRFYFDNGYKYQHPFDSYHLIDQDELKESLQIRAKNWGKANWKAFTKTAKEAVGYNNPFEAARDYALDILYEGLDGEAFK